MSLDSYTALHDAIDDRVDQLQSLAAWRHASGAEADPKSMAEVESRLDRANQQLDHVADLIRHQQLYIDRLQRIRSALNASSSSSTIPGAASISPGQYARLPDGIRRRVGRDQLSQYYEEIRDRMRSKYSVLSKPRSSLTSDELIQAVRYERQEQRQTRGRRFICLDASAADTAPGPDRDLFLQALIQLGRVCPIPGTAPPCYTLTD